jgi:hypothetical protein
VYSSSASSSRLKSENDRVADWLLMLVEGVSDGSIARFEKLGVRYEAILARSDGVSASTASPCCTLLRFENLCDGWRGAVAILS